MDPHAIGTDIAAALAVVVGAVNAWATRRRSKAQPRAETVSRKEHDAVLLRLDALEVRQREHERWQTREIVAFRASSGPPSR